LWWSPEGWPRILSLTSELCLLSVSIAEEVGFSAATPAEEGSTESLWAELPPELLEKVLEAACRSATQEAEQKYLYMDSVAAVMLLRTQYSLPL
jgi:hypothetical protein